MSNTFYTNTGRLTPYALACGYVEEAKFGMKYHPRNMCPVAGLTVRLWHDGTYHVRAHDHNKNERICWETFTRLTEARRFYDKTKNKLKKQHEKS